jgi:plastocyanin
MRIAAMSLALIAACASLTSALADDRDSPPRRIVTVGFGAGMNTNQPGNPANHHVIPDTVRVNVGDVVNFAVAGLHIIRVYGNGVKLSDVKAAIPDECEVNPVPPATFPATCGPAGLPPVVPPGIPPLAVYYQGINPLATPPPPPPAGPPAFVLPSSATNRVETVSFLEPGRFLVICAVLPHFNDKMYAWIEVRPRGQGGGHDHD